MNYNDQNGNPKQDNPLPIILVIIFALACLIGYFVQLTY